MAFDFFNTSYLAFGTKITRAFRNLAGLLDNTSDNISLLEAQLAYYNQYMNKNYKVPVPQSGDSPVQANQIYQVLKVKPIIIKTLKKYGENGLEVAINYINDNNKITYAYGCTDIGNGYCYAKLSTSNNTPSTKIKFVDVTSSDDIEKMNNSSYIRLFKYKVQSNNDIILSNISNLLPIIPSNWDSHYADYQLVDRTEFYKGDVAPYDVMVIVTTPYESSAHTINVRTKDGEVIPILGHSNIYQPFVLCTAAYLQEGDKLTGDIGSVYEVNLVNRRRVE